jgi:ribosomal protein S18 acetylase RimI-like enzyme
MINTNQIDKHQSQELQQLADLCKKRDGSVPNLYMHILTQHRTFPASLLYYEEQKLLGFLSVYFFYDDAVEISLLVHPEHRKRGIAKKLIQSILPLVQLQNYSKVIFSTPKQLNNKWLTIYGYSYLHSEYYMERNDLSPLLNYNKNLSFRTALVDDIPILCTLDDFCFPNKPGDLPERFAMLLNNRDYRIVLAFHHNVPIGKAHIRWQEDGASLSDIAIHPTQQGRGFGTSLIAYCINQALSEGKPSLNLDVETHNQRALNLYTRLGFSVQNACDFWSIEIERIIQIMHQ